MPRIAVDVDDQVMAWLHALAVVRDCSVEDLLATAVTHLRISPTERARVVDYRRMVRSQSA